VCVSKLCVSKLCSDKLCECKFCDDKMCDDKMCEDKWCVSKLCEDKLCVDKWCEDKLCVDKLCGQVVWGKVCEDKRRDEGGGRRRRDTEPKTRTPHKDVGNNLIWYDNIYIYRYRYRLYNYEKKTVYNITHSVEDLPGRPFCVPFCRRSGRTSAATWPLGVKRESPRLRQEKKVFGPYRA